MALDIHRLDNNEYIFGLNDKHYNCLSGIFEQFRRSTGIDIDQYGDTTLYIDNVKLLIKLIDSYIQKTDLNIDKNKTSIILEFKGLLNMLLEHNFAIKLYGD